MEDYLILDIPTHTISDSKGNTLVSPRDSEYLQYIRFRSHLESGTLMSRFKECFTDESHHHKILDILMDQSEGYCALGILLSYISTVYRLEYIYFNPNSILLRCNPHMDPIPQKYMIYREIYMDDRGELIDRINMARKNVRLLREMDDYHLMGLLQMPSSTGIFIYWIFCDTGILVPQPFERDDIDGKY